MKEFRAVFGEELELRVGVDCMFLRNVYLLNTKEPKVISRDELELCELQLSQKSLSL